MTKQLLSGLLTLLQTSIAYVRQLLMLLICLPIVVSTAYASSVNNFTDVENSFAQRNFERKAEAIEWLITQHHPQTKTILDGLLNRAIAYQKHTHALVLLQDNRNALLLSSNKPVTLDNPRDYKKVAINNALRTAIQRRLSTLDVSSTDLSVRLAAVKALTGNTESDIIEALRQQLSQETSPEIKAAINLALNIARLGQFSQATDNEADDNQRGGAADSNASQLALIQSLSDAAHPAAQRALAQAEPLAKDPEIRSALTRALSAYEQRQRVYNGVETLYFGLSMGSVLVLAGIGLAITFGVMGVINMAHGELIMLGAYTTYVLQQLMPQQTALALLLAIPAAFVVSGLVGVAIERSVIRFLYGRPLETLLATFGISLILQQAVRSIFSPLNRSVTTPDFMSGMLEITPMLSLTWNRLIIIGFCILIFTLLLLVLKKTSLGLQVRAVSQNRGMARAMGVRSEWVDAMTFGLGSGVAGIAGVALSQLTNVGPNMGQSYIIDSFMVVVFGGVGNLWGTLVAGLSLGIFNKILEPWAGAVLAKILVLVFIILFIQKRPRGLFPQRGRAVEG
ncbi:urea ABC transporter permease subunit UrtB [Photobacterium sp. CAU 1568]|uniref:Urea ABC transporter permease subunit UrtB n=2 Tax=Photobacterium arenosum TaxID=2774143 RepID=A0ABR9BPK8_9GAMM|nr:urea ABC transporter permease subunit UrtB [Photobacterium arenosum]MBD8514159.1 urea ABC transporter permease subunit UrtB [Photobacterium arenosum]